MDPGHPPNGTFEAEECYSYLFGLCPDPMGKCVGFKFRWCGCSDDPDYNGDGFVTGIDFDLFVRDFEAGCTSQGGDCTGNADYNDDGFITGIDFDQFVQDFECCG